MIQAPGKYGEIPSWARRCIRDGNIEVPTSLLIAPLQAQYMVCGKGKRRAIEPRKPEDLLVSF